MAEKETQIVKGYARGHCNDTVYVDTGDNAHGVIEIKFKDRDTAWSFYCTYIEIISKA